MRQKKVASRKRIFVCSPYRGSPDNLPLAKELCKAVIDAGHSPMAPHVFYTLFLDDQIESDRSAGIECGTAWLRTVDEVWIFAEDKTQCSTGMLAEVEWSEKLVMPPKLVWMPQAWERFRGRGKAIKPQKLIELPIRRLPGAMEQASEADGSIHDLE